MKVLFVSEEFPFPLDTGGNVRTFHLLRALASEHDVVLLCVDRPGLAAAQVEVVRRLVREVHLVERAAKGPAEELKALLRSLANGVPFILERHRSRPLQRKFESLLKSGGFDAVHFNHLDAALYADSVPASLRTVLDQHNVVTNQVRTTIPTETRAIRRGVLRFDLPRLAAFETELCNRMRSCLVCSEQDADYLKKMGVGAHSVVVPNGVDLDYFQMSAALAGEPHLVFVGTLDYDPCEKGVWFFCNEVLPKIREKLPAVTFTAVGRNPSQRLLKLRGAGSGIEFAGRVEDLRPHVHAARVFVVPLLSGSGTRLKVLEAMAMGVPVVSTAIGAEGIAGTDGEHLRLGDTPEDFARAVLDVIGDDSLALRIRAGGRRLVERSYSWQEAGRRMLTVYTDVPAARVAARV